MLEKHSERLLSQGMFALSLLVFFKKKKQNNDTKPPVVASSLPSGEFVKEEEEEEENNQSQRPYCAFISLLEQVYYFDSPVSHRDVCFQPGIFVRRQQQRFLPPHRHVLLHLYRSLRLFRVVETDSSI